MKIGIIGAGKMGEAIIQGLIRLRLRENYEIQATSRTVENAKEIEKRLQIDCHTDNKKLTKSSEIILLCTKPYQAESILNEIQPYLDKTKILISICASLSTRQLSLWCKDQVIIIRAMPNTPCLIGEGMTVIVGGNNVDPDALSVAEKIFKTLGKTIQIDESLMNGATGLSGCGPAYVYLIIEALSEAGVKVGLPRKVATLLAAQTLSGAAQMVLQRDIHPAELKDEVTTPAGCTVDGLVALEKGKIRVALINAVVAAAHRSQSLAESKH